MAIMSLITVMLLNVGALGAAFYRSTNPVAYHAPWMRSLFVAMVAGVGGTIAGFAVIYLFIQLYGLGLGIVYWIGSSMLLAILFRLMMSLFPLIFALSQLLMIGGYVMWLGQYS